MSKLVTYGGGEFTLREIDKIDQYVIKLTNKDNPVLLYIPTASNDEETDIYDEYYKSFGCEIDKLFLINDNPSQDQIESKFERADIIFAGGGDAILLMNVWQKYGIDKLVRKLYHTTEKVFCGISAGSICYYEIGHTDSLSYHSENWDYYRMHGCGLIPGIHSPHFNEHRKNSLIKWMKSESLPAFALDNCCALSIIDGEYKVITSDNSAKCHLFINDHGKVIEKEYGNNEIIKL